MKTATLYIQSGSNTEEYIERKLTSVTDITSSGQASAVEAIFGSTSCVSTASASNAIANGWPSTGTYLKNDAPYGVKLVYRSDNINI